MTNKQIHVYHRLVFELCYFKGIPNASFFKANVQGCSYDMVTDGCAILCIIASEQLKFV